MVSFALILLAAMLALSALLRPGIAGSDDILDSIYRVFALDLSWQQGVLYPRLSGDLAYAYGAPLFLYYPPLASFTAELFHLTGLGLIESVKAAFLLALLLSGLGVYLLVKAMLSARISALLAALAYIFAPYQLLDIYIRGALAESLALALLPWILWTAHRLCSDPGPKWFLLTSLATAALLLTHNSMVLFFLPVLAAYIILNALLLRKPSAAWLGLAAIALALGLSAFFWLPAVIERRFVTIDALAAGSYDPRRNLVALGALIQRSWAFEYGAPAGFRWSLASAVFTLVGITTLRWQPKVTRIRLLFFVVLLGVALVLQLTIAHFFWDTVPLVRFIQFPWRLLGFVSLSSAVLIGSIPSLAEHWRRQPVSAHQSASKRRYARAGIACGIVLMLGAAGMARLWPDYETAWRQGHFEESDIGRRDLYERGRLGFELFSDYQPVWVDTPMSVLPDSRAGSAGVPTPGLTDVPHLQVLQSGLLSVKLAVETQASLPLAFHWFYFPGWQVRVDGRAAPAYPSGDLGLLTTTVPPGNHTVDVRFQDTLVRRAASILSLLGVLACIGIAFWLIARPFWRVVLLILASLVILMILLPRQENTSAVQGNVGARFEDQALLVGYSLDKPIYQAGETLSVALTWFGITRAPEDYKVFVHLRDEADTQMIGQHDGHPVFGFTPTSRWEPGEVLIDRHEIPLPSDLPPGRYSLLAGMYRPDTQENLAPSQAADVWPENRVFISEIVISE